MYGTRSDLSRIERRVMEHGGGTADR